MAQALGFNRATTPCVATLHLVFRRLDREAFEALLGAWLQGQGLKPGEALAVDGKTLRGIHGQELPGVHLVAAYAHQSGIVVAQGATGAKGQEVATLQALLEQLPLQGRVVTGDAQFAQREISRQLVAKGGLLLGSKGEPADAAARHRRPLGSGPTPTTPGGTEGTPRRSMGGAATVGLGRPGGIQRLAPYGSGVST